jgi:hypothetical protein
MALSDSFVNIAQVAAASAIQGFVGNSRGGSGFAGPAPSKSPNPSVNSDFQKKPLTLFYPSDIGVNPHQASYILFTGFEVVPAKIKKGGKFIPSEDIDEMSDAEIAAHNKAVKALKAHQALVRSGTISNSLTLSKHSVSKSGTVIGLYMPPSVNVSYSMDYERAPIGPMSEAIAGIIQSIQNGASVGTAIANSAGSAGQAIKQKGIGMIDAVIPGAKDLIAIDRGVIITPRTELMFRGISRRQFSFEFNFIPKDSTETEIVRNIVMSFKSGMTPSFIAGTSTREMTIPDVFQIDYMHVNGKNDYLHKIGKCYLEKMDVTYGGDKFVTYNADNGSNNKGAPPQRTKITLAFKEIEIMDRAKVVDNY